MQCNSAAVACVSKMNSQILLTCGAKRFALSLARNYMLTEHCNEVGYDSAVAVGLLCVLRYADPPLPHCGTDLIVVIIASW